MEVTLLDLKAQYDEIRDETEAAVREIFESQQFVLGPTVARFEREMEAYTGAAHAIGCASGSDALLLALMALGVGRGDRVVTTSFSFFATAGAPARLGARVVFADIDPETFNVSADTLAEAIDRSGASDGRTVLLPVHLYGLSAPMEGILDLGRRIQAPIVEDAAQAIGAAASADGTIAQAGTIGDFGALSFFPSKNLGGAGDGGMLLVRDPEMAERVGILRVHGSRRRYEHDLVGVNSRLDALQAAILSVKLRRLDEWSRGRRERAAFYTRLFRDRGLDGGPVRVPPSAGPEHVFHQYVIRAERRDDLRGALEKAGIGCQVYYPVPLHRQPCFQGDGFDPVDLPEADRAAGECLALPIYPQLSDDQIEYVVATIEAFYRS